MSISVPVLDLSRFDAEGDDRAAFLAELREAAHTLGGFYLAGHGVDAELIEQGSRAHRRQRRQAAPRRLGHRRRAGLFRHPHAGDRVQLHPGLR